MRKSLLGIVLVASTAPVFSADFSDADFEGLRKAMDSNLRDSVSARFKDVKLGKDGTTVCGFVNAKNSYGAYTGYEPFLATKLSGGRYFVAGIGGSAGAVCHNRGM